MLTRERYKHFYLDGQWYVIEEVTLDTTGPFVKHGDYLLDYKDALREADRLNHELVTKRLAA